MSNTSIKKKGNISIEMSNISVVMDNVSIEKKEPPELEYNEDIIFMLKDGEEVKLNNFAGVAKDRICTMKSRWRRKKVNILINIRCDIICVVLKLMPRSK